MKIAIRPLRIVASVLLSLLVAAPAVSAHATEYRIPLKFKMGTPGEGQGELDPGEQPDGTTPTLGPRLRVSPGRLMFDSVVEGVTPAKSTILKNIGTAPAVLLGITSTKNFGLESDCPHSLPAGAQCSLSVSMLHPRPGTFREEKRIMAVGDVETTLYIEADIDGAPPAALEFEPSTLNFDRVMPGVPVTLSSTLTNIGVSGAPVTGLNSSNAFNVVSDCAAYLEPGNSCTVSVTYSALKVHRQEISVPLSPSSSAILSVSGSVDTSILEPKLLVTGRLDFGPLNVGESETKSAKVTSVGTASAPLDGIRSYPDFAVSSNCPAILPVGSDCDITVIFTARGPGEAVELMQLGQPGQGGVEVVLRGLLVKNQEEAQLTYSPEPILFDDLSVGMNSVKRVRVTSTGATAASGVTFAFEPNSSSFTQKNNCPATLSPGEGCDIDVSFFAQKPATLSSLLVATLDTKAKYSVGVQGGGFAAILKGQTSVDFGIVGVGQPGAIRYLSLKNIGNLPVTGLWAPATAGQFQVLGTTCTSSLNPDQGCSFALQFAPAASGKVAVPFSINSENGGTVTVSLEGQGTLAQLAWAPNRLDFAPTALQELSSVQSFTLSNPGADDATNLGISVVGGKADFAQSNDCDTVLRAGSSCTVSVQMRPSKEGILDGTLFASAAGVEPVRADVTGSGYKVVPLRPQLEWGPGVLEFEPTKLFMTSAVATFELTNVGDAPAKNIGISVATGKESFQQNNSCGEDLDVGQSCTVNIWMVPAKHGDLSATVFAATEDSTPVRLDLKGYGYEDLLQLSSAEVTFSSGVLNTPSAAKQVKLTNLSSTPAKLADISVTEGTAEFVQTSTCGSNLGRGASCTISVTNTPRENSSGKGILKVDSDKGQYFVALAGPVITPEDKVVISESLVVFEQTALNVGSTPRVVTFKNIGTAALAITTIKLSDSSNEFTQTNTCGSVLAAGATCEITLVMTPAATGLRTGELNIATASQVFKVSLEGKGVRVAGGWTAQTSSSFGTVTVGKSTSRGFKFSNTGGTAIPLYAALAGAKLSFLANNCGTLDAPILLNPGNYCAVLVEYAPTELSDNLNGAQLIANSSQFAAPKTIGLSGKSTTFALTFDASPSANFGLMLTGSTAQRTFILRNTSSAVGTLAEAPTVTGSGFTLASTTCAAGLTMTANKTCSITVTVQAVAAAGNVAVDMAGSVEVQSSEGVQASLALQAQAGEGTGDVEFSTMAEGALSPGDFGQLLPGASSTRTILMRNVSLFPVKLAETFVRTGGTGTGFSGVAGCSKDLVLAPGKTCSTQMTVTTKTNQSPGTYYLRDELRATTTEGKVLSLPLTAEYTQDEYNMEWVGDGNFGSLAVGEKVTRVFYLYNRSNTPITLVKGAARTGTTTGFAGTGSNTCVTNAVIQPGKFCSISIGATGKAGPMTDTMYVTILFGLTPQIVFTAN